MEGFKRRKMWDERFWLFKKILFSHKTRENSIVLVRVPGTLNIKHRLSLHIFNKLIFYYDTRLFFLLLITHESIFQLFTFPALYITLTNTLTHKDKDRESESEKEQNAPKRPRCCLLGFLLIAVVVRER